MLQAQICPHPNILTPILRPTATVIRAVPREIADVTLKEPTKPPQPGPPDTSSDRIYRDSVEYPEQLLDPSSATFSSTRHDHTYSSSNPDQSDQSYPSPQSTSLAVPTSTYFQIRHIIDIALPRCIIIRLDNFILSNVLHHSFPLHITFSAVTRYRMQ